MEIFVKWFILALVISLSFQRTIRHESESQSDGPSNYDDIEDLENCNCDTRHVIHYEAKGCRPVQHNVCGCPVKFECPNPNEIEENDKVCQYKEKNYVPGEQINTGNPCQHCRCSIGSNIGILCTPVECPQASNPPQENCHDTYEDDQCCPVKTVCIEDGNEASSMGKSNVTCEYNGRLYPLGARMYSNDDPCEVCLCNEEYIRRNGTSSTCTQTNCIFEKYKAKLLKGCIPIYQEQTCCPIDFYCAPSDDFINENKTEESEMDEEDLKCIFFGHSYKVGETVSNTGERECLSCVCQVPPDMTCVQQTCSPNPMEENCYPYYRPGGGCCPKYECLLNDDANPELGDGEKREMEDEKPLVHSENEKASCSDTPCDEGMICMLYQVNCGNTSCLPLPTCMRTNSSCPTPVCNAECVVTEHDSNYCPTCVCGKDIEKRESPLKCQLPVCVGLNCLLVAREDGCPKCCCSQPCAVTECPPGCNVLREVEGQCPICVCEDETEGCPTPVCEHEGCIIENLPNGCPTCVCGDENTGRELEENQNEGQVVNSGQQQQQQQQQVISGGGEYEAGPPPNVGEASEDDDTIVFMSSGVSGQNSNVEERSVDEEPNHNNSKSKILSKSNQHTSNTIQTFGINSQSGNDEQLKPVFKYMLERIPERTRPDP